MALLSLHPIAVGQVGVGPASFKMRASDSLATIQAAGYLVQGVCGQFLPPNALIDVIYNFGTSSATNITLAVSINTAGVISLVAEVSGGLGQAALKSVSNNALPSVSSVSGATVVNDLAAFADVTGTVKDSGVSPSDATKAKIASVNGATVVNHLAVFSDVAGTVSDGGFQMKSVAAAAVAGGAASQVVTDAFCTTGSMVLAQWNTSANAVSIQKVTPGAGSFTVLSSADPGASTLDYIITKV